MASRAAKIALGAGYLFAVLVLFQFVSVQVALSFYQAQARAPQSPPTVRVAAQAAKGLPTRLKIPSIRVNAVIRSVGLTVDGSMGVPKIPRETAWYMHGPKPGEPGSAVIAGHVNWLYGATAVFARLKSLRPGDIMTVQDDRGLSTSFVVRETRIFGPTEDATSVFRSTDGKSHLNLITCGGIWDRVTRMYSKRLVVFADRVEE